MKTRLFCYTIYLGLLLLFIGCNGNTRQASEIKTAIVSPEELYGPFFYDVMSTDGLFGEGCLFSDSKDFVDCAPLYPVDNILDKYQKLKGKQEVAVMESFIQENFSVPKQYQTSYADSSGIDQHITKLWAYLMRLPNKDAVGTLIPLHRPYIVPGGRFREIYYWDSYFTMLGLREDKCAQLVEDMVYNFSDLIDEIGFIPNGNRSYYTSRSQPPFYAFMVDLYVDMKKDSTEYTSFLGTLEREYAFWMRGAGQLSDSMRSNEHTVRMPGGEVLNRYYDSRKQPRAEMYINDMIVARDGLRRDSTLVVATLFQNIRSAAESGWDFSSRWLCDKKNLYTIQTLDIVPVDLNSLLFHLERTLAKAYRIDDKQSEAEAMYRRSEQRREAVVKYCWDARTGYFRDYNWKEEKQTDILSLAGVYPLFVKMSTDDQALAVSRLVQKEFLKRGGVVTTTNETGEQWDAPNGWAPLQWITYVALKNYGYTALADTICDRWMALNKKVYGDTFRMFEKYDVEYEKKSGGGEYPNQDGFGWTNGVYRRFVKEVGM